MLNLRYFTIYLVISQQQGQGLKTKIEILQYYYESKYILLYVSVEIGLLLYVSVEIGPYSQNKLL